MKQLVSRVSRVRRVVVSAFAVLALAAMVVGVSFVPVDHADSESTPERPAAGSCVTWRNGAGGGELCYR